MTKKRLFVLLAIIVVMAISVLSLAGCKKDGNLENDEKDNTQVEQPIISDNNGSQNVDDSSLIPTGGMDYQLSSDGKSFILTDAGSAKEDLNIVIPSTHTDVELGELPVTEIGARAFKGCKMATLTFMGENLKVIGVGAFRNCASLSTVVLPKSITTIGESAFRSCGVLNQFSLPKPDGSENDKRAPKTTVIPDSVQSIGDFAFLDCTKIDNVVVSENVTSIGRQTFMNCTTMKNIRVSTKLETIGEEAFRNCSSMTQFSAIGVADDVAKETLILPSTVTEIGKSAFEDNGKIKKAVLPVGVSVIPENLFRDCSKLAKITIENKKIKEISDYAFSGCNSLSAINSVGDVDAVNLSDFSLERIGKYAFSATSSMTKINLPRNLTTIDAYAFRKSGIAEIDLLGGLRTIGKFAFEECDNLAKVGLPATLEVIDEGAFRLAGRPITVPNPDNAEEQIPTGEVEIAFDFTGSAEQWDNVVKLGPYVWGNSLSEIKIACHGSTGVVMVDLVLTNPTVDKEETPELPDTGDTDTDTGTDTGTENENNENNENVDPEVDPEENGNTDAEQNIEE